MSTDDSRSFLENAEQTRGYTLEMHRIMAEVDQFPHRLTCLS